jgi:hypothetical protein
VIPALRRLRQKDLEFEVSLGYIVIALLKNKNTENKQQKGYTELLISQSYEFLRHSSMSLTWRQSKEQNMAAHAYNSS